MKAFLIAGAAGLATFALPTLAQRASGPLGEWSRSVTRTQAEEKARAEFALADTDKDGFVTREELRAAAEARMAEHRNMAFDRLDADHNGTITREEFSSRLAGPGGARVVEHRIERTSPDGKDGGAGGPGMRVMMMHRSGPGGSHMMMADSDKDGHISQAEAVAGALKLFDQTDTNHDGTVTPEERRAAMQAWGAKMREMGGKMHGPMDDMPSPPPPPAG